MVLHKPENKHVLKAFDLTGKVAVVTGRTSPDAMVAGTTDIFQEVLVA